MEESIPIRYKIHWFRHCPPYHEGILTKEFTRGKADKIIKKIEAINGFRAYRHLTQTSRDELDYRKKSNKPHKARSNEPSPKQRCILEAIAFGANWYKEIAKALKDFYYKTKGRPSWAMQTLNPQYYYYPYGMDLNVCLCRMLHRSCKGQPGTRGREIHKSMNKEWIIRKKVLNIKTGRRQWFYTLTEKGKELIQIEEFDYRPNGTIPEDYYAN